MNTPSSNRNNPKYVQYYRELADVMGIFWQFHDERLRTGNIDFAVTTGETPYTTVPYSPQKRMRDYYGKPYKQRPFNDFAQGVGSALNGSWQQFLVGNEIWGSEDHLLMDVAVPDESKRFFDPFVTKKLLAAKNLGTELASYPEDFTLSARVAGGLRTGSEFTAHLQGVFGEEFKPIIAIAMAKVKIDNLREAGREIGLSGGSITLLDNSSLGLDRNRLRELGVGDTLGCPAAMQVSSETKTFLAQRGVNIGQTTMLGDFATKLPKYADDYIGTWFRGLTPEQRVTYIDREQLSIMTGETRRNVLQEKEKMSCPYGKER